MPARFTISLLLANVVLLSNSYAQQAACPPVSTAQIVSDVVVSGARVDDGYGGWTSCGVHGQVYRNSSGRLNSIQRVSPDGSTLVFGLPDDVWPATMAPAGSGLNVLTSQYSRTEGRMYEMYHFDEQANVITHRRLHLTFFPERMAVTSSGRAVVVGHFPEDFDKRDDWKYGGAIFDADDQLIRGFDLPLPPGGGGWTFASPMLGGNGAAYVMLHANAGEQNAIATISESGNEILNIKFIAAPPDTPRRHGNIWLFGPGVAVEEYIFPAERPHGTDRFDEYDLSTGEKIATKTAPPTGFQFGCYLGDEESMLANSVRTDPARHLSPNALRLVTSKLKLLNGQEP